MVHKALSTVPGLTSAQNIITCYYFLSDNILISTLFLNDYFNDYLILGQDNNQQGGMLEMQNTKYIFVDTVFCSMTIEALQYTNI